MNIKLPKSICKIIKNLRNFLRKHILPIDDQFNGTRLKLSLEATQKLNRLVEKSGAKDIEHLLAAAIGTFEMMIDAQLYEKKIVIYEPNGVDNEEFDLLGYLNESGEEWKDPD